MEQQAITLREEFVKSIDGKDFVLYAGLLDLAHQMGLLSIQVELIQFPGDDNHHTAICKASAHAKGGPVYIDIGDANPLNCNSKVGKHLIRMASTRAKARALRDLTNIGMTCLEELGDADDVASNHAPYGASAGAPKHNVATPQPKADRQPGKGPVYPMTDAQRRAILTTSKRRGIDEVVLDDLVKRVIGSAARFDTLSTRDASTMIQFIGSATAEEIHGHTTEAA